MSDSKKLTTSGGSPIGDNQNALTAGPRGPVLIQDYQLMEKLAHQNRERIPERTLCTGLRNCAGTHLCELAEPPIAGLLSILRGAVAGLLTARPVARPGDRRSPCRTCRPQLPQMIPEWLVVTATNLQVANL